MTSYILFINFIFSRLRIASTMLVQGKDDDYIIYLWRNEKKKATTTAWLSNYHLAVEGLLFEIFDYIFGNILNGLETL